MKLTRNVLLAASLIANQSVFAAAFQLRESNTEALGHAVAGSAALKNSIAAMSNNPATMTSLPSHEVGINSAFVGTKNKFTQISASNTFTAGPARFDVTGTPGEDGGGNFVIPAAYLHMKVNPELSVGLNYTVPFGLTTKYDEYWIGRFFAIESKIATHDFNLAVAYKVHPMVSLGGGVSTQYADAKLSKAIDNRIINAALKDGYAKVSGDDLSYGFNLGAVFEPSDMVRLGIHYRSSVKHNLKGDSLTEGSSLPTAPNGRKDIYTDLELPGILTFSGIYEASPEVSLMANLEWTKWSTLKEVVIRNSSDGSISDKEEFDYSNVWFFSVGAKYKYNDVTTLKLGFAFDNTPSKNEHRSPRLPDEDKWWLSVGLSYAFSENVHSSLDYTYVGVNRPNINLKVTSPNGALIRELKGHFDANVHIVGAKLAYQI